MFAADPRLGSGWWSRAGWVSALFLVLSSACAYRPVGAPSEGIAASRSTSPASPAAATRDIHIVRPGETLYSIAWEAGLDYRDVAAWNGIAPPYLIKPGQEIRLTPPATVRQDSGERSPPAAAEHVVARGETLYSIARRYGLTVRELAAWNGIAPPYMVYPGQRLRLNAPAATAGGPPEKAGKTSAVPHSTNPPPAGRSSPLAWIWPAEGELIARFDPRNGNKGIDIGGRPGQAILAAAPGLSSLNTTPIF
jgi:lipoprotein NlpD